MVGALATRLDGIVDRVGEEGAGVALGPIDDAVGRDLDTVCDATGETGACAVLRKWDGRSDRSSVGVHIFEEFIKRAPTTGLWEVPFDAADPFNTPRDLNQANPQVQQA